MGRHVCSDTCEQHKICIGERCVCRRRDLRPTSCYACRLAKTACRPGAGGSGMCERCLHKGSIHYCNRRGKEDNPCEGLPASPPGRQYLVDFGPNAGEALLMGGISAPLPYPHGYQPISPPESVRSGSFEQTPTIFSSSAHPPPASVPALLPGPVVPPALVMPPALISPALTEAPNCGCPWKLVQAQEAIDQQVPLCDRASKVVQANREVAHSLACLIRCPYCFGPDRRTAPFVTELYSVIGKGVKRYEVDVLPFSLLLTPGERRSTLRTLKIISILTRRFGADRSEVGSLVIKITELVYGFQRDQQLALAGGLELQQ
ncbi:hypothetical protein GE21DRAFT_1060258 [Neurospora crassa]|nr:hypothetical protein GE21DRAFT_1060258 [Neurospora crassa]